MKHFRRFPFHTLAIQWLNSCSANKSLSHNSIGPTHYSLPTKLTCAVSLTTAPRETSGTRGDLPRCPGSCRRAWEPPVPRGCWWTRGTSSGTCWGSRCSGSAGRSDDPGACPWRHAGSIKAKVNMSDLWKHIKAKVNMPHLRRQR